MKKRSTPSKAARRMRGFERASSLASSRIRTASESRGFAESRLLTHWADIVGPDIAAKAEPVDVKYGRGFGATLTILTTGAQAPMLEMEKPKIRDRVNACYGYSAIQTIRITQTSATGFEDGKPQIGRSLRVEQKVPALNKMAVQVAEKVTDNSLREALERLGSHVVAKGNS